ncbi:uncharacterized protein LOC144105590 [Amblyomma americanum]
MANMATSVLIEVFAKSEPLKRISKSFNISTDAKVHLAQLSKAVAAAQKDVNAYLTELVDERTSGAGDLEADNDDEDDTDDAPVKKKAKKS